MHISYYISITYPHHKKVCHECVTFLQCYHLISSQNYIEVLLP